ncbi:DUF6946 family protein [Liberiplasma polymorphum]|uniref:DUF6946 family protein n=1 Tax=Liberiplasma polymorphum TaxID=3374570 RepID=UPI003774AD93
MKVYFRDLNNYASSFEDLEMHFLKFKEKDWKDHKSAKSLSRYVHTDLFKKDFTSYLLENFNANFKNDSKIFIEKLTKFDEALSGSRDHDLCSNDLLIDNEGMTLCIEAKVNEEFSALNSVQYLKALSAKLDNPCSKFIDRICSLFFIFSSTNSSRLNKEKWGDFLNLRYQLFTGLAGTIAEAKRNNSGTALFLVLSFKTEHTDEKKQVKNKQDYLNFLDFLGIDKTAKPPYKLNLNLKSEEKFEVFYAENDMDIYIDYLSIDDKDFE